MKALANAYFIIGTAYAGKSTMIRLLAKKYEGILCEENYHLFHISLLYRKNHRSIPDR